MLQKGICVAKGKILQVSVISVTLKITESVMCVGCWGFFPLMKQWLMGKIEDYKICIVIESESQCQMSEALMVEAFQLMF